jgi:hypothetical protein
MQGVIDLMEVAYENCAEFKTAQSECSSFALGEQNGGAL